MICPDCQVLVVTNIKTYDRVQYSQKGFVKYSSMLGLNVKSSKQDEETERNGQYEQAGFSPIPKFRSTAKKPKLKENPKKSFDIYEDIEFFHFEKAGMVQGKIIAKNAKNGKYSVLVAKSVPPQMLDISPIFINKINCNQI